MPGRGFGAHRRHRRGHITTRKSGPHPRQVDPVGFAESLEEKPSDGSGPASEDPGRREIDDVEGIIRTEQNIAVVEVGQSHAAAMEFVQDRPESVKQRAIEPGSCAFPQRFGVHPTGHQGKGPESTEKGRQGGDARGRFVGRRLTSDQPATEAVPHHSAPRSVGLDRKPLAIQLIKENVGLGAVSAHDPANRLDPRQAAEVESPASRSV